MVATRGMTPSQLLRKMARENREMAAKLRERADKHERWAAENDRQAEEVEAAENALPSITRDRSMFGSKMEIENERANKRVKIAASMTSDSDAKRALLEAGITSRDVASLLGVGHSTVNAWCTGARSIPRGYVDRLREKHRIPAKVWPKISG